MFMFPEPPPLGYYMTDVTKSYLSDGIFYHGKAAPCHKYIAKQLKPIKRTLRDPIAPPQELNLRDMNRMLDNEKELYVNASGKDDGMVYNTLKWMPKWKRDRKAPQEFLFSVFPRSSRYELSYIRKSRLKDSEKCKTTSVEQAKEIIKEDTVEADEEPCHFLKPPIWWKGETGKPRSLPVGNIDDYWYERIVEQNLFDTKISEKLHMDHPKKYIPGVIHRMKDPKDTSMKDVLERADSFKVTLKTLDTSPKDSPPVEKCICSPRKSLGDSKLVQDLPTIQKTPCVVDHRWQPLSESTDCIASDVQRRKELRKLSRPFSHELHTWYSKNKPTKLQLLFGRPGKKPVLERRFSHL